MDIEHKLQQYLATSGDAAPQSCFLTPSPGWSCSPAQQNTALPAGSAHEQPSWWTRQPDTCGKPATAHPPQINPWMEDLAKFCLFFFFLLLHSLLDRGIREKYLFFRCRDRERETSTGTPQNLWNWADNKSIWGLTREVRKSWWNSCVRLWFSNKLKWELFQAWDLNPC